MMGPKKLSEIREDLRRSWAESGQDPIQRLHKRIRELERSGKPAEGSAEVLHSLRRLIANLKKETRRPKRAMAKK
jgi:hypothetical protein